jgi:hypothetical protein
MAGPVDDRWPRRVADHLTVVLAQTRNPSRKMTARVRRAPDTPTWRRERIAGIHGLSIDTIELYERNIIDELALRLVPEPARPGLRVLSIPHRSHRQTRRRRPGHGAPAGQPQSRAAVPPPQPLSTMLGAIHRQRARSCPTLCGKPATGNTCMCVVRIDQSREENRPQLVVVPDHL